MQNSDHELDELLSSFDDFIPGRTYSNTSSPKLSPLFPKAAIGKSRRSRASKKAPTTLLTADATNFRALVQQFTGFQSGPPTFGSHKGPINLNFEQYNYNSEKPEALPAWNMNEESDQSLVSFRANDVSVTTTKAISDGGLFVSRFNHMNSRPDPLTVDDFDVEMSSGPYSAPLLPGTSAELDDFWRY